jgi:exonuclease SbcC
LAVIDGRPVSEVRTEYRVRAEGADGHEKHVTAQRNDAAKAFTEARTKAAGSQQSHQAATTSLEAAEQKLAARLAAAGLSREAASAALEKGEGWVDSEQDRLNELRNGVATTAATLAERRHALAEHDAIGKPAADRETTRKNFTATENSRQEAADAQASALADIKADDLARSTAAEIRAQLDDRIARADVWNQLDDLIGSADGAKFRRFVQALTLERLLRRSNRHLADLAPRYQLECAPGGDLTLQVVDRHMGDEVRGVHNLSGGERFLVSLALALGLAAMSTSQGIRVDTLFIDEGFGALDSTSLALAISALESLQATGRKVGVIFHIAELKERIGVQVQVTPRGGGRSEIEVIQT